MSPSVTRWRCVFIALLMVAALAGCSKSPSAPSFEVKGGDRDRGAALIGPYGCGTCHRIPGVAGAHGSIGPPLAQFADRTYIAGVLTNTPANLMKWLRHPQSIIPGNAMPDMGVTEQDARDLAAFLYTLR